MSFRYTDFEWPWNRTWKYRYSHFKRKFTVRNLKKLDFVQLGGKGTTLYSLNCVT